MSEYNYYPNTKAFDFDRPDRVDAEEGNCPNCGKEALQSGRCAEMDSAGLLKCSACGWNCDYTNWTETEMHRLRAEVARLKEEKSEAIARLNYAASFYCGWYDTGVPQMDGAAVAYSLKTSICQVIAILSGDSEEE